MLTSEEVKNVLNSLHLAERKYIVGLNDELVFTSLKTVKKYVSNLQTQINNIQTNTNWYLGDNTFPSFISNNVRFYPGTPVAGVPEGDVPLYFIYDAGFPEQITLQHRFASATQDGILSKDDFIAFSSSGLTSVGLIAPSIFNVSGSPLTSNGDITLELNTQIANRIFAGPSSGANAVPTFRSLVSDDIPNLAFSKITGVVPINQGGTNLTSLGSSLQILRVNSGGTALEYATLGTISGLTSGRIPYANSATSITDDANLQWNHSLQSLGLGNPTFGAAPASLVITPLSTRAAIRLDSSSPSSPSTGEMWYNSANTEFVLNGRLRLNASGTTPQLVGGITFNHQRSNNVTGLMNLLGGAGLGNAALGVTTGEADVFLWKQYGTTTKENYGISKVVFLPTNNITLNNQLGNFHSFIINDVYKSGSSTNTITVTNSNLSLLINAISLNGGLPSGAKVLMDMFYIANGDSRFTSSVTQEISILAKHGHVRATQSGTGILRATNFAWGIVHTEGTGVTNTNGYGLIIGAINKSNTGNVTNGSLYGIYGIDYSGNTASPRLGNFSGTDTNNIQLYNNRWQLYFEGTNPTNVASYIGAKLGIGHSGNPTNTGDITAILDLGPSTTNIPSLRIRSGTAPSSPVDGGIWYDGTSLYFRNGTTTKTIQMI